MLLKNDNKAIELQILFLSGRNRNTGAMSTQSYLSFPQYTHTHTKKKNQKLINRTREEIHAGYFKQLRRSSLSIPREK